MLFWYYQTLKTISEMKKQKILVLAFAFFVTSWTHAQEVKHWSLEQCINYAFENNLNIKLSDLSRQNIDAQLQQSKLSMIPSLNFNLFNSWRWGRSIDPTTNRFANQSINSNGLNGSTSVILFNGNRQVNTIRQGKKELEASHYDMEKSKNDIALQVVGGYLNVIFAREQFENANNQLNTTRTQVEQTQKLVDAGSLPITNLLDLTAQEAGNEVDVINAENEIELALLQLKQLLQIPASELFDVVKPEFDPEEYGMVPYPVDEVYQQALGTQPEIRSANLKIESADYGIKLAKGAHIPALSMNGQFFTNYSSIQNRERIVADDAGGTPTDIPPSPIGQVNNDPNFMVYSFPRTIYTMPDYPIGTQWLDNRSWSLGLNISIPVFNGYITKTNVQRAEIMKESVTIEAENTRNVLRQTIERAYNDAEAAVKIFDAATKQVEALQESFRATERSFNLGAKSFVDYQVASSNLFRAKSDLTRAKFDYIFKLKILDFYLGNPLTL